ncbi:MAG: hypothetical protein ACOX69_08590, partial [Coriobacteriales bacterium]
SVEYAAQLMNFGLGHLALFVCAALYLGWWFVFFYPRDEKPAGAKRAIGIALLVGAVVAGVVYVWQIMTGVLSMHQAVPLMLIVLGCAALYVVLLGITYIILNRPVTTELALIVGWLLIELFFLDALASSHVIVGSSLLILAIVTIAAFIVSVVCYCLYYAMKGKTAFIDGAVPLAVIGCVGLIFALLIH